MKNMKNIKDPFFFYRHTSPLHFHPCPFYRHTPPLHFHPCPYQKMEKVFKVPNKSNTGDRYRWQADRSIVTKKFLDAHRFPPFFRTLVDEACQVGLMEKLLASWNITVNNDDVGSVSKYVKAWVRDVAHGGEHGAWFKVLQDPRVIQRAFKKITDSGKEVNSEAIRQNIRDVVVEAIGEIDRDAVQELKTGLATFFGHGPNIVIGDKSANISKEARDQQTVVHVHFFIDHIKEEFAEIIRDLSSKPGSAWDYHRRDGGINIVLSKRFPKSITLLEIYKQIVRSDEWNLENLKSFSSSGEFTLCYSDRYGETYAFEDMIAKKVVRRSDTFLDSDIDKEKYVRGSSMKNVMRIAAYPSTFSGISSIQKPHFLMECAVCKKRTCADHSNIVEERSKTGELSEHERTSFFGNTIDDIVKYAAKASFSSYRRHELSFPFITVCEGCIPDVQTVTISSGPCQVSCRMCMEKKCRVVVPYAVLARKCTILGVRYEKYYEGNPSAICLECFPRAVQVSRLQAAECSYVFELNDAFVGHQKILAAKKDAMIERMDPDVLFEEEHYPVRARKLGMESSFALGSSDVEKRIGKRPRVDGEGTGLLR